MVHRHEDNGIPQFPAQGQEGSRYLRGNSAVFIIIPELRKPPARGPVISGKVGQEGTKRHSQVAAAVCGLPSFLGDEPFGGDNRVVIEDPFLDHQPEREPDPPVLVRPEVLELLADPDGTPEEGVLVGRIRAVPLDDGVDFPVFFEGGVGGHSWCRFGMRGEEDCDLDWEAQDFRLG